MMQIKVKEAPVRAGRTALLLCDDNGEPLPGQHSAHLDQKLGEPTYFTVTFVVDGKKIALVG